jgi:hypothetical protein
MVTAAERKTQRDTSRKRKGKKVKRNHQILLDPTQLAFPGWETVDGVWDQKTVKMYISWCHIDKLFPLRRHELHIKLNCANMHFCKNDEFVQRCVEVWRFLYGGKNVVSNDVTYSVLQMVYAEIILQKVVDWRTIKKTPQITKPTVQDIPRAPFPSANPRDGLTTAKGTKDNGQADEDVVWLPSDDEGGPSRLLDETHPIGSNEEGTT